MEWRPVSVGCSLSVDIESLKLLSSVTSTCIVIDHFLYVLWEGSEKTTRKTSPWKQGQKEVGFGICSGQNESCSESCREKIQLPWQIMLLRRRITTLAKMSWNGAMKKVRIQWENHWLILFFVKHETLLSHPWSGITLKTTPSQFALNTYILPIL